MFLVTIYANALVAWRQYIKEAAQVRVMLLPTSRSRTRRAARWVGDEREMKEGEKLGISKLYSLI